MRCHGRRLDRGPRKQPHHVDGDRRAVQPCAGANRDCFDGVQTTELTSSVSHGRIVAPDAGALGKQHLVVRDAPFARDDGGQREHRLVAGHRFERPRRRARAAAPPSRRRAASGSDPSRGWQASGSSPPANPDSRRSSREDHGRRHAEQASSASDAPTAGQKNRMSLHMSRSCTHAACSRSVLMRVSTSDCTDVRLSSASSTARSAQDVTRSERADHLHVLDARSADTAPAQVRFDRHLVMRPPARRRRRPRADPARRDSRDTES